MADNDTSVRTGRLALIVVGSFVALLVLAIVGGVIWLIDRIGVPVSGTEFHAGRFEARRFLYMRSPFSGAQRSGLVHEPISSDLLRSIRTRGWIPNDDQTDRPWILARLGQDERSVHEQAAAWLRLIEDLNFDRRWNAWIDRHPVAGRSLFPAVVELARLDLYDEIPGLIARFDGDPPDDPAAVVDAEMTRILTAAAERATDDATRSRLTELAGTPFSERNTSPPPSDPDPVDDAGVDTSGGSASESTTEASSDALPATDSEAVPGGSEEESPDEVAPMSVPDDGRSR